MWVIPVLGLASIGASAAVGCFLLCTWLVVIRSLNSRSLAEATTRSNPVQVLDRTDEHSLK